MRRALKAEQQTKFVRRSELAGSNDNRDIDRDGQLPKKSPNLQKGGDPAAPSDTATLLRLHPSYQALFGHANARLLEHSTSMV